MHDWKAEICRRLDDPALTSRTDIVEEMAQHVEQRYRMLLARGHTEEQAYDEALQELSDLPALIAGLRATVTPPRREQPVPGGGARRTTLASVRHDLRYAIRLLIKNPGFTSVAVMALALGVGANTAIFSVVNTVMLRPLPFAEPDRLVRIWESNPEGGWPLFSASHPNFLDWRSRATSFERLAAITPVGLSLTSSSDAEIVRGNAVTVDFLPALGVSPIMGRNFRPEEDRAGNQARVVMINYGFWHRHFAGDPTVLQKTLTLSGATFSIVGVLPESFFWDGPDMDLLVPLAPDPARARGDHRLRVIGKLRPGTTIGQAHAELSAIAAQLATQFPESNRGWTVRLSSFRDWIVPQETRQSLLVFAGAVLLVLLIACGNVASLLLARATEREKEISIRAALGAERWRIVRQLLVEALLLSTIGGAIGIAIAYSTGRLLLAYAPDVLPRLHELSLDARVLAFALLSSLATGLLFGIVPALQASRPNLTETLKEGAAGAGGGGARRQRLRNALVVGEVALSVALLIGAGLLIRSFWRLQHVNLGFDGRQLLTMRLNLPGLQYRTGPMRWAFYDRLLSDVRAMPGVREAATSSIMPLGGGNTSTEVRLIGKTADSGKVPGADWRNVSPGYFRALGIPLRGRDFSDADSQTSQPVTILSEAAARLYFPNEDPIGKTIILSSFGSNPMTVIGVAGDVRNLSLDSDPGPTVYGSARVYSGWNPMFLAIRGIGDAASQAAAVRAAVRAIDPSIPVYDVRTADDLITLSLGSRRFNMYLLGCFAAIALVLACIGLFGVMAYIVSQRTRDIGIRLALGAAPGSVLRHILGQGLVLTIAGLLLGVTGGLALTGTMRTLLYSVEPTDVVTFVSVPLLLVAVAVLACYIPARRATRVDPLTALRSE
jgi:putative ABC transport system permease protein